MRTSLINTLVFVEMKSSQSVLLPGSETPRMVPNINNSCVSGDVVRGTLSRYALVSFAFRIVVIFTNERLESLLLAPASFGT